MKKRIIVLLITLYVMTLVGCMPKEEQIESQSLVGHIVIEGNALLFDSVEIILLEDVDRIAELGLKQQDDLPNGYYIHNQEAVKVTYELTNETIYNFVDYNLLFVLDKDGDRSYTTTNKEEFIQHLNISYADVPPAQSVPFFIEVEDDKIISITEKFEYTI